MSERTQSPQNVVVPVDDLLFYKLKDLLLEQSEGAWTDAMIVRDAHHFANHLRPLLAAAPAPPSLAGGEDEIALIVAQACLDYASDTPSKFSERTVALGEITKSAVHRILSALSPEAPAREGEDRSEAEMHLSKLESLQPAVNIGRPDASAALEWARERLAALTPRHEAPADLHERNLTASNAELIEQALSHPPLEAPDDTVTISRPEYEKLKSGYPGDPSLLHEAPAEGAGELWPVGSWLSAALDDPKVCDAMKADIREWFDNGGHLRARSSAPEAREGEVVAWRFRLNGSGAWSFTDDPHAANGYAADGQWVVCRMFDHPAAPSADKLREARQDVINQMADGIEKLSLTPAKRELVKAAFRACIKSLSTPDALKGDAK